MTLHDDKEITSHDRAYTKKPHQINDKTKKAADKPKDCGPLGIYCLGDAFKSLIGGGGGIPGLETAPKIPLIA